MKIRNGFVSNSSSSSFILGFDIKPRSVKELHSLLFGDMEHLQYYSDSHKTLDLAKRIFKDLKGKRALSIKGLEKAVGSGYFPGYPDTWNRPDPASEKLVTQFRESFPEYKGDYWAVDKITRPMAKQLALKIHALQKEEREKENAEVEEALKKYMAKVVLPKMKGKKVYALEYGDHERDGAAIEHGGAFTNIDHIQISHH
jgi:hypothetical protein